MKHKNGVLVTICILVTACFGLDSCSATEPNEQDILLAKERMEQLRQAYKEYEEAIAHFLKVNADAIREQPDLAAVEVGRLRMDAMERTGWLSKEKHGKFLRSSEDPNEVHKMVVRCSSSFGMKAMVELLGDPNWAWELRPALLLAYRLEWDPNGPMSREGLSKNTFMDNLKEKGYTVFDPTDPNDERLWENIKRHALEKAEHYDYERQRLLQKLRELNYPECVAEYAGMATLVDGLIYGYNVWLYFNTPENLVQAAKGLEKALDRMDKTYRRWHTMLNVLADETNPYTTDRLYRIETRWDRVRRFLSGETNLYKTDWTLQLCRDLAELILIGSKYLGEPEYKGVQKK